MRKNSLSVLFIICFVTNVTLSFGQRNIIVDGRFDNATIHSGETNNKGEWFYLSIDDEKSVKHAVGDEHQGTVAYFSTTEQTNIFKSFIGQLIQPTVEQGVYRISFSAKSMTTDNAEINLYIRKKNLNGLVQLYASQDDSSTSNIPISKVTLSNNWEYFSVDFDLSEIVLINDISNSDKYSKIKSDESALSNFYLAFSSLSPNAQIRFTDVSMRKIN